MPVIFLWDLRNSNAPQRTLQRHEMGVLSLSWCDQDSNLLISCGKDNKTIVWNPQTGESYGEFSEMTNWTFMTRFSPTNPQLSATASLDGTITIQTLQNTNPSATQVNSQTNLDGEDFFTNAQSQPQGASFSLKQAPKWFERPTGSSFGFGGKLVVFKQVAASSSQKAHSVVEIKKFSVDSDIGSTAEKFEEALRSSDIKNICESHLAQATSEEDMADWRVMETLMDNNPRQKIVTYLQLADDGFITT
jgi:protein transport protein SEC31